MNLTVILVISALVLAVGAFLLKRQPSTALVQRNRVGPASRTGLAVRKTRTRQAPRSPYRATSIEYSGTACAAAKAISGKRFLDTERVTPALPLARCDASRCTCNYLHHEDRRESNEDRRHPGVGLVSELYKRGDRPDLRKKKRGRRKTDWA